MTNEEAIQELILAYDLLERYNHMNNYRKEAFNKAKNALEQGNSDEDCISRAELLKHSWTAYPDGFEIKVVNVDDIKALPPIQPKAKIGHWISIKSKRGTEIAVRCDCCGNSPKHSIRSDFCPNCGAKMEDTK